MDQKWMKLALSLAKKGEGRTSPNPMVGAVLVANERVIARGYHHRVGGDHAEVDCLKKVGFQAPPGSTLYVSLEPCCHTGRTPPCTEAIIKSGVVRVVAAVRDPNPKVAGKGLARLKKAGIDVHVAVCEEQARALNRFYFHFQETGWPYVLLKAAVSLDGKVAMKNGESRWITGEAARAQVHRLRRSVDAIVVGIGTVIQDDPELSVRHVKSTGPGPLKVIFDPALKVSSSAKIFSAGRVLILCHRQSLTDKQKKAAALERRGVDVYHVSTNRKGVLSIHNSLKILAARGCLSVMVEGGPRTYSHFLESGAVDEIGLFVAPKAIGHGGRELFAAWGARRLRDALEFSVADCERVGEDLFVSLRKKQKVVHD